MAVFWAIRKSHGRKARRFAQLANRTKRGQERLLEQVFRTVRVARLQVEPGEHQPRRPADKLFEGSPIAASRPPNECFLRVCHEALYQ